MKTRKDMLKKIKAKPICSICEDKGWYFVNEWVGALQGRKDCKCATTGKIIIIKDKLNDNKTNLEGD